MEWTTIKIIAGISGAAVGSFFCGILGGWDSWLEILVLFMVLDYITGLAAGFIQKKLHSGVAFAGVCKKVFVFALVAVAYGVDQLMGTEIIRVAVIGFYIGVEGLSILKNAGIAGLPLPAVLENALEEMREKGVK